VGVVAVDGLHTASHADQLGQLGAMHFVVTSDEVINKFCWSADQLGQLCGALQKGQFFCDSVQIQALVLYRLAQANVAAAAKIELQTTKYSR
jgi:hypothetical protein